MIKAVIFDVDGVLLDSFEPNFVFYQNLMRASGYEPPTREQYQGLFHKTIPDAVREMTGLRDKKEIDKICHLIDVVDALPQKLTAGVPEIVMRLQEEYQLAIVTSRPKTYAYESPLDTLKKYFSFAIAEEDTAKHKPDPEPLFLAAEKLNVQPRECVYVGDVENDMKAAHAAGMKFILFSHKTIDGADAYAENFHQLPDAIKAIEDIA